MLHRNSRFLAATAAMTMFAMLLTACGGGQTPAPGSGGSQTGQTQDPTMAKEETWAVKNGLDKTETPEELYEQAKNEGSVTVYSVSSRIKNVKESFKEKYPGIEVEAFDISQNELLEKIAREYESGIRNCDVVHCKENTGSLYAEFIEPGVFHAYRPSDIVDTIERKDLLQRYLPMYYDTSFWFYNDEVNPNGSPVTSWWDLTKPEWKGKYYMIDPLTNESNMALMTTLTQNSDLLEADYEKVFGEKLTLSPGCENAAQELMKRMMDNHPIFESSAGKIVENIGTRGQKGSAPVGYASSVKMRERKDQDWALMPVTAFTPNCGIIGMNTLNIVNEAPHPAAAKLLVRWMMGEADGQGVGFEPFNSTGGWSARSNVPPAADTMPFDQVPLFKSDYEYIYENLQSVTDFWLSIQN